MIHWTPEGCTLTSGLNVYATKQYFRFIWLTTGGISARSVYFRFSWKHFRFYLEKTYWDIIENFIRCESLYSLKQ